MIIKKTLGALHTQKKVLYKCQTNKIETKEIATFHNEIFTRGIILY